MKAFGLVFDDVIISQMTIVLRFSLPLRDRGEEKNRSDLLSKRNLWKILAFSL